MSYESEYFTLDLAVALGVGKFCDLVAGDHVSGRGDATRPRFTSP